MLDVFLKKRGGIEKSFEIKNFPYKIDLMRGRDWAYFKKWYVFLSIYKYLRSDHKPIIFSTNWELSEGLFILKNIFDFHLLLFYTV